MNAHARPHLPGPMGRRLKHELGRLIGVPVALVIAAGAATSVQAAPEIRIHDRNRVPACVTPERLMQFLEQRNRALPDRFKRIAVYYKLHGDKLRVRWDYAFFQMLIETNFLTYRAGSGKWGDVKPNQNNFAGIGATGGGVPGDRYPNVSTGVLAQMQHLVAYSGEIVDHPVAPRTREVQQKVVELSRAVGRPITYRDLAGRWAADKKYGNTIASVAERFRTTYCRGEPEQQIAANERPPAAQPVRAARAETTSAPRKTRSLPRGRGMPAEETLVVNDDGDDAAPQRGAPPAARAPQPPPAERAPDRTQERRLVQAPTPAVRPRMCKVWTASYGGSRNVLIQTIVGEELHLTALQVLDGQEEELAATFIESHAVGGRRIGDAYPNREAALVQAFDICPQAARLQQR
jgi:Mannosyl-glycoprotein endo-beta-N-acetylglucosaminidase